MKLGSLPKCPIEIDMHRNAKKRKAAVPLFGA